MKTKKLTTEKIEKLSAAWKEAMRDTLVTHYQRTLRDEGFEATKELRDLIRACDR